MDYIIETFDSRLLDQLNMLPPDDWDVDAYELFMNYEWQKWFHPYQIKIGNKLAAFGMIWINADIAWLGWILVGKKFQRQGLGTKLSMFLTQKAQELGAEKVVLTATKMGQPVYEKLNFKETGMYRFFKIDQPRKYKYNTRQVRKMTNADVQRVCEIDFLATGENRKGLINYFVSDILVYEIEGEIKGFYMEKLGNGFIAATNNEAGTNLLLYHARNQRLIVIPQGNDSAVHLLLEKGYTESYSIPRMTLNGLETNWKPGFIYSRGSGYCG
jgi:GNAT superfamily N-acetyltransferase